MAFHLLSDDSDCEIEKLYEEHIENAIEEHFGPPTAAKLRLEARLKKALKAQQPIVNKEEDGSSESESVDPEDF